MTNKGKKEKYFYISLIIAYVKLLMVNFYILAEAHSFMFASGDLGMGNLH